jgi:hypothetical protein
MSSGALPECYFFSVPFLFPIFVNSFIFKSWLKKAGVLTNARAMRYNAYLQGKKEGAAGRR